MYLSKRAWLQQATATLFRTTLDDYLRGPYPGGGQMTISVYDTAWVALVRAPHDPQQLAFPISFRCLLDAQADDGSWGGAAPYSLLSTMAALMTLIKAPLSYQLTVAPAVQKARSYLDQHLATWSIHSFESIGFELLVPALLVELEQAGVTLTFPAQADLMALFQAKRAIAPLDALYKGLSTLLHSLEAFGGEVDMQRVKPLQAPNGSYGCSPAATAAALLYGPWDDAAAAWLHHLSQLAFENTPGAMPNVHPTDVFDTAWGLCLMAHGNPALLYQGTPQMPMYLRLIDWLEACLSPQGVSMSRCLGMPWDADDTSMTLTALYAAGQAPSIAALQHFERASHFVCYELERNPSTSVNAHVLTALLAAAPVVPAATQLWADDARQKIVAFLYETRHAEGFWSDKFFLGPYYGTSACVLALAAHPEPKVRNQLATTLTWLLDTQSRTDGGWGIAGSTLEETAYVVLSLSALQKIATTAEPALPNALRKGFDFLWQHLANSGLHEDAPWPRYEKLWLGKELYAPQRIVTAAILAALSTDPHCLSADAHVPFISTRE